MLLPIDEILTAPEIHEYLTLLSQGQWQDGRKTAGGQAATVKANLQLDDHSEIALQLRNHLLQRLGSHPTFISATLAAKIFPPKFNCYQDGGRYGLHVDNAIMQLPDNTTLRTDISATLFLTDPDSYVGGELVIETQYGIQEVKLPAGDMIIYPSTSLHEVRPVTQGQRICSFFWIQSLVRDANSREQLFDLDQTIQALTMDRGHDDREVRQLTGLYHNLMRRWAES